MSDGRPPRITDPGFGKGRPALNEGKTFPPTRLEPEQVAALLRATGTAKRDVRNRALIGVLYRTGIEIAEAIQLEVEADVDLTPGKESIWAHGGRLAERTLALDYVALDLLRPWLVVRAELRHPGDYLFCTVNKDRQGNPLHDAYVREYVHELAVKAGLPIRVHLNAFRHTLAAELLVEGWPLPYLQAQLGIQTLAALQNLFDHLNIRVPPSEEVMEIIRTRPPGIETYSP